MDGRNSGERWVPTQSGLFAMVGGLAWLAFAVVAETDQAAGQQAMPKNKVVQEFLSRVQRSELNGVSITYRTSGGMPGEVHVHEPMTIVDGIRAEIRRKATGTTRAEAAADVGKIETLFQKFARGMGELVPREQARFVPDSLVGSVTIEIGGQSTTLFYLADAEQRRLQNKPLSPDTLEALEEMARLSRDLAQKNPRE